MIHISIPDFDIDDNWRDIAILHYAYDQKPVVFVGLIDNIKKLIVVTHADDMGLVESWRYIAELYNVAKSNLAVICCYPGIAKQRAYNFRACIIGSWQDATCSDWHTHSLDIYSQEEYKEKRK